jgi:hypothetical protein
MRSNLHQTYCEAEDENWEDGLYLLEFMDEFMSIFCPENKATTALMTLKSDQYFQGR